MMNQNEEHEDILFEEKKKQTDRREAGMGADGEFSADPEKVVYKGRRSAGGLRSCRLPDGGPDGWKESERVPDHGSEFRYPDGIYHEPEGCSAVGIRKDGEDK